MAVLTFTIENLGNSSQALYVVRQSLARHGGISRCPENNTPALSIPIGDIS